MPIYVYLCQECKREEEYILPLGKEANICIYCGGRLKKILKPPAIQFKGSGFYINDYAKKENSKDRAKDEKESVKEGVSKK